MEEMGVDCDDLTELFVAHYRAQVSNELTEDEVVHVFGGSFETGAVAPDYDEVSDWKWMRYRRIEGRYRGASRALCGLAEALSAEPRRGARQMDAILK
jgi:isopentenyldiphosphate isomerase